MSWGSPLSIVAHGGELDVHLLGWIKDLLDDLLGGLGDWGVVALAGAMILVIPVGLMVLYFSQRKRGDYDAAVD
ncbi:MAG: hypothetical protein MK210_07090 [Dehalococcoidia bacterium]|nr:hypothetical protein [Dehalococcoidia bacterium]MCH8831635.1 hypothetical protein [Chloroflexota bacterium]